MNIKMKVPGNESRYASKMIVVLTMLASFLLGATAQAAQTVTYYHTDAAGSVVAASDDTGSLLWRKSYSPYGEKVTDGENDPNAIAFTGKKHDDVTGLTYMGARYYDPEVGRFMGMDSVNFKVGNPMSFNRFAYANDNPYKFFDPDGKEVETIKLRGFNAANPGLKLRTYYVEKKIASNVKSFVAEATKTYPGISVNNAFRLKSSSEIVTTNTKATGLSRHNAGFAIDLNGTKKLNAEELGNLRKIAKKHKLYPLSKNPDNDKGHFSANPTKYGYKSRADAVDKNKKDYLDKTKKKRE